MITETMDPEVRPTRTPHACILRFHTFLHGNVVRLVNALPLP